jgi:hypothetical protein
MPGMNVLNEAIPGINVLNEAMPGMSVLNEATAATIDADLAVLGGQR